MTDFAALVAELKDAALDAGATWDRCSDEFQEKLEARLHGAERALLAALAAPTAKGGTEAIKRRVTEGIHGGNATGSTAEMLRAIASDPDIKFPLPGGMDRRHLRERATYLESATHAACELTASPPPPAGGGETEAADAIAASVAASALRASEGLGLLKAAASACAARKVTLAHAEPPASSSSNLTEK